MALEKQLLPVPLAVGENLGEDPRQSKALQRMVNCYIKRTGEIQKRPGTAQFGANLNAYTSVPLTSGTSLVPTEYGPGVVGSTAGITIPSYQVQRSLFSTSESTVSASVPWNQKGRLNPLDVAAFRGSAKDVDTRECVNVQVAEVPGYRILVYSSLANQTAGGLTYDLYSLPSMQPVVLGGAIASMYAPFYVLPVQSGASAWNFIVIAASTDGSGGGASPAICYATISALGVKPTVSAATTVTGYRIKTPIGFPGCSAWFSACNYVDSVTGYTYAAVLCTASALAHFGIVTFTGGASPTVTTADTTVVTGPGTPAVDVNYAVSIGPMQGNPGKIVWFYIDGVVFPSTVSLYVTVATAPQSGISYAVAGTTSFAAPFTFEGAPSNPVPINVTAQGATIYQSSNNAGLVYGAYVNGANTLGAYILLTLAYAPVPIGDTTVRAKQAIICMEWNPTTTTFVQSTYVEGFNCAPVTRPFVNPATKTFMQVMGYVDEVTTDTGTHNETSAVSWLEEITNLSAANFSPSLTVVANLQPLGGRSPFTSTYAAFAAGAYFSVPNNLANCPATATYAVLPVLESEQTVANSIASVGISAFTHAPMVFIVAPSAAPVQYSGIGKTNAVLIGGASPQVFASTMAELGFIKAPDKLDLAVTSGSALTAGVYSYVATYEWTDSQGNVYSSAPSRPIMITVSAPNLVVTVKGRGLAQTALTTQSSKKLTLRLVFWRTTSNGTIYRRVGAASAAGVSAISYGGVNTYSQCVTAALTDDVSDTLLNAQAFLPYQDSVGALLPLAPPSTKIMAASKSRVFIVPDSAKTQVWPSNDIVTHTGLTFSADLAVTIPEGGAIAGICPQDALIIVGKSKSLYAFGGDGPDAAGNGAWSDIQRISADTGVRDANSMVNFSEGTLFKSDRGYYHLDRTLTVQYIGRPVQTRNTNVCKRALLMPTVPQLRFLEDDGLVLAYDYEHKAWSEFDYSALGTVVDICVSGTDFYLLTSDGKVWKEDTTGAVWNDNGTDVMITVRTPWVNLAGVEGFQRCWWMHLAGDLPTTTPPVGPIGTTQAPITDGDAQWQYMSVWAQSTAYTAGDIVQNPAGAALCFYCIQSGNSAGSGTGPTGVGTITDGTCKWVPTNAVTLAGAWTPATYFSTNSIVTNAGKLYYCLDQGISEGGNVEVKLYTDYNGTTPVSYHRWSTDAALTPQVRIKPLVQKCTALMAEINIGRVNTNGATTAPTLSAMELVLGIKGGKLARLGSAGTR